MEQLTDNGYPVYGANGKIGYYHSYTHERPTLLITCRGATCGTLNISEPFSYVNGNAMALDDLSSEVELHYLFFYLLNRNLNDVISGSAQPQITRTGLEKVKIPLPPLQIQKKIAAVLEKADELRRKREEQIKRLDDLLQATFLDMFGDPVTNPKGWRIAALSKFAEFENGDRSSNYPNKDDFVEEGILFLMSANIKNRKLDLSETRFITREKFATLKNGRLRPNDIVFTLRGNGFGKCSIFDCKYDTGFINAQMVIIRPIAINPTFLHAYLTSCEVYRKIRSMASGSAQPQLTSGQLTELKVPLPPLEIQDSFAKTVDIIERQKSVFDDLRRRGEILSSSLMQRAFKGELELK